VIYGNYDSGLVTLTNALAAATALNTRVIVVLLVNLTTQIQTATVQDGVGGIYVPTIELQPLQVLPLEFNGVLFSGGVKWNAGANGVVNGQVMGFQ
jgi:hypothetical protein